MMMDNDRSEKILVHHTKHGRFTIMIDSLFDLSIMSLFGKTFNYDVINSGNPTPQW